MGQLLWEWMVLILLRAVPRNSTPEQYVREITIANDGILDQSAVHKTGLLGFDVIQELEEWGVKFQKR